MHSALFYGGFMSVFLKTYCKQKTILHIYIYNWTVAETVVQRARRRLTTSLFQHKNWYKVHSIRLVRHNCGPCDKISHYLCKCARPKELFFIRRKIFWSIVFKSIILTWNISVSWSSLYSTITAWLRDSVYDIECWFVSKMACEVCGDWTM